MSLSASEKGAIAALLKEGLEVFSGGFVLNQPYLLTTYNAAVGFKKKAFIGEEIITIFDVGITEKRGVITLYGKVDGFDDIHVEIPLKDALVILEDFKDFYDDMILSAELKTVADVRKSTEDEKAEAKAVVTRHEEELCPEWGTW